MKKILLIITAGLLFFACKEDNLTDNSDGTIQTEYTIEELENDPNWVEFTDFRVVDSPCINPTFYEYGKLVNTKELFDELDSEPAGRSIPILNRDCADSNFEYKFNFKDSTLLLFYSTIGGGGPKTVRKVFYNNKKNKYVYILKYGPTRGTYELVYKAEALALPKISSKANFVFDTTLTWEYLQNQ